jgi:hypothetical protein
MASPEVGFPIDSCRVLLSPHEAHNQADNENDEENEKKDLGDLGRTGGNAAEADIAAMMAMMKKTAAACNMVGLLVGCLRVRCA